MRPSDGRPARLPAALLLGLLASCAPGLPQSPAAPGAEVLGAGPEERGDNVPGGGPICRVGPDGGPLDARLPRTADRGIGGTGGPLGPVREADRGIGGTGGPSAILQADRGIGGTGSPAGPILADRGIGGTGIIAVITGFASVCLAGQEVALDPEVPVQLGSRRAASGDLRAGQVALIEASGAAGTGAVLRARRVEVRYEATGPVGAAEEGLLRVAGQPVVTTDTTQGIRPGPGDWVAVSGLRRPDGTIEATRIDRAAPGEVAVHGHLHRDGGLLRIGTLQVRPAPGVPVPAGGDVVAVGVMEGGVLRAEQLAPDLLASDPGALFRAGVAGLLVETFAVVDAGRVRFGQGFSAAAPGVASLLAPYGARRAVLALERAGDGGLRATGFGPGGPGLGSSPGFRPGFGPGLQGPAGRGGAGVAPGSAPGPVPGTATGAAPASARHFDPAPMPDRAVRAPEEVGQRPGGPGRSGNGTGRARGRFSRDGTALDGREGGGSFLPAFPGSGPGGGPVGSSGGGLGRGRP